MLLLGPLLSFIPGFNEGQMSSRISSSLSLLCCCLIVVRMFMSTMKPAQATQMVIPPMNFNRMR